MARRLTLPHPTPPQFDVRAVLERVYGVGVEAIHTVNFEGKKKRGQGGFYRRADYKKVFVLLKEPWTPPKAFFEAKEGDKKA